MCDLESVAVLFVLGDVSFFLASNAKSFYHCCFIGKNDIQKERKVSRRSPAASHKRLLEAFSS